MNHAANQTQFQFTFFEIFRLVKVQLFQIVEFTFVQFAILQFRFLFFKRAEQAFHNQLEQHTDCVTL